MRTPVLYYPRNKVDYGCQRIRNIIYDRRWITKQMGNHNKNNNNYNNDGLKTNTNEINLVKE